MSCDGVVTGLPLEGEKMLFGASMSMRGFHLRLDRERHVDRHLIAVEVRVVSGTNERMNADRFAFDELRLEGLDGEAVQRGRAVQQHRVALGDFFQDVPDFGRLALDHLLGASARYAHSRAP